MVRWSGGQVVRWSGGQVVRWSGGQVVRWSGDCITVKNFGKLFPPCQREHHGKTINVVLRVNIGSYGNNLHRLYLMIIPYFQRRAFDMDGLQLLIEQQNEFEAYKSEKARQLEEHVNHLKYLITTEFLSTCPDFDHEIKEDNVLSFKYKELILLIQIVNPITEKRNEKEYNFAERATKRLKVKVTMKRKKAAHPETFEILDVTQYKKNGPYTYKYDDKSTEDFLELLNLFFKYFVNKKVEFNQSEFTGGFGL